MIRLLFIGDGPRDHVTVPHLISRLLGIPVKADSRAWRELRLAGGGYRKKLRFAIRQARDAGADGVVATVDTDKNEPRSKLNELKAGREEDRASSPPLPTALGEATPHGEAWLLDDRVAVSQTLGVEHDSVPVWGKGSGKDPKAAIEELRRRGGRAADPILEVLEDIARKVEPSRCANGRHTGFDGLSEEVRCELAPAVKDRAEAS